jgi:membrane protein DedA with SNARE-associated domain
VTRAVLAAMAVLVGAGLVGSAFAPVLLLKNPLLLLVLSPDARHIALAVGSLAPLVLFPVVVVRRSLFSLASYGLGAIYGEASVTWVERRHPRIGGVLRFLERLFGRFGSAILVILPFASICILAGAARSRFIGFVPAIVAGHTLWVGAIYLLGAAISDFTSTVLSFLSEHLVESTLVCVALVVLAQLLSKRRRTPRPSPS